MARISAIADTGFVVGSLDVADQWHGWAAQQFSAIGSPALTERYALALRTIGVANHTLGAEATWAGLHALSAYQKAGA